MVERFLKVALVVWLEAQASRAINKRIMRDPEQGLKSGSCKNSAGWVIVELQNKRKSVLLLSTASNEE